MLLIFVGSVAVATLLVVGLLKLAIHCLGIGHLIREGAVLAENELEYLGPLWVVKRKANFLPRLSL
jgi:hypothetical protein